MALNCRPLSYPKVDNCPLSKKEQLATNSPVHLHFFTYDKDTRNQFNAKFGIMFDMALSPEETLTQIKQVDKDRDRDASSDSSGGGDDDDPPLIIYDGGEGEQIILFHFRNDQGYRNYHMVYYHLHSSTFPPLKDKDTSVIIPIIPCSFCEQWRFFLQYGNSKEGTNDYRFKESMLSSPVAMAHLFQDKHYTNKNDLFNLFERISYNDLLKMRLFYYHSQPNHCPMLLYPKDGPAFRSVISKFYNLSNSRVELKPIHVHFEDMKGLEQVLIQIVNSQLAASTNSI